MRYYDEIYAGLKQIMEEKGIDRPTLSLMQREVVKNLELFDQFYMRHKLEVNLGDVSQEDFISHFSNLNDILFKIEDINQIDAYMVKAIERYDLVAYVKRLAEDSERILKEKYGEAYVQPDIFIYPEMKTNDGIYLYKSLLGAYKQ